MSHKRVPRVGILVESGRDGLEVHMCRKICALLRAEIGASFEERIVPMDNKPRLLKEAVSVAQALLDDGCRHVVVLWDEEPAWPHKDDKLCWSIERKQLLANLQAAGLENLYLVCIEKAFEAWLMFDGPLLSKVLSRQTHKVRASPPRHPDRLRNIKGVMKRLFKKHGAEYVDYQWAPRLSAALESLVRLRKCPTFCRFADKVITGL